MDSEDHDERLLARCRCHNVSFEVKRPGKDYEHGTGKFRSSLCACNSCRIVSGFEITSWTSVPEDHIVGNPDLAAFLKDTSTLGFYESSPKTGRYFCATCGATVLYHKQGRGTVDIATGLFEPTITGVARVEAWLEWKLSPEAQSTDTSEESQELVGFSEDAVDAGFVRDISKGMKRWEIA